MDNELELDQIQEMESLGYFDHYQWCQKNQHFIYRTNYKIFNGLSIPKPRIPKGSKALFAFFNLAPELSQYPKRNKSIMMAIMQQREINDDDFCDFGSYLHTCYLKKGSNIGYTALDFNYLLSDKTICNLIYEAGKKLNILCNSFAPIQNIVKVIKYTINNLNNSDFDEISKQYYNIINEIKKNEEVNYIGHFVLEDFSQITNIKFMRMHKYAEIWTDSPVYMIYNMNQ